MPRTQPWTYADYLQLDDDRRYELIGGELLVTPAPRPLHQEVALELSVRLRAFVKARGLGKVYVAPVDVVLSDTDVVQPDVLFVPRDRLPGPDDLGLREAPPLVVEVLSPSSERRDLVLKMDLYARAGAAEYWIVDPWAGPTVEVRVLTPEGTWTLLGRFGPGEQAASRVLDGFSLDPAELVEE